MVSCEETVCVLWTHAANSGSVAALFSSNHTLVYLQNEKVLEGGAERRVPISCRRGDFVVVEKM